jgi:hypothetical protein
MTCDFKSFNSIEYLDKLLMRITQKIHGSNSQIRIDETETGYFLRTGSRNRWIMPHDDNFGFSKFVYDNGEEFLRLGPGTHYGEWAGPGINSGEGLTQRTFFLFSHPDRYNGIELPPGVTFVPELYYGPADFQKIQEVMEALKTNGSYAVPGFRNPEGIVIEIAGKRYKKTFTPEESKWDGRKNGKKVKEPKARQDYSHLLQPLRLEKLLSRDERYLRDYPESLPQIAKDYFEDLIKEGQLRKFDFSDRVVTRVVTDEDEIKQIRKEVSRDIFHFIKSVLGALRVGS